MTLGMRTKVDGCGEKRLLRNHISKCDEGGGVEDVTKSTAEREIDAASAAHPPAERRAAPQLSGSNGGQRGVKRRRTVTSAGLTAATATAGSGGYVDATSSPLFSPPPHSFLALPTASLSVYLLSDLQWSCSCTCSSPSPQ
ncbi:hypothetical protein V9T40_001761 [Parthenolecanium corni]|uniref:Uncharacterized protein n=1 Tax=Parthenolecanium corni TaxID=536013 RepID=A0AAN9Y4X5_9HEMI